MREPLLALGVLLVGAAAVWFWITWRRHRVWRSGAEDLVRAYDVGRAGALVLAFTTPDCVPCKTVQRPALEALERRFPGQVITREIDALDAPDLAQRFGILTVPSTVVIGPDGEIRAINHGAATTNRLILQAGFNGTGRHR